MYVPQTDAIQVGVVQQPQIVPGVVYHVQPSTSDPQQAMRRYTTAKHVSTAFNVVGILAMLIGSVTPIRRFSFESVYLDYYLFAAKSNGHFVELPEDIEVPYAIALAFAIATIVLSLVGCGFAVCGPQTPRRGCSRLVRPIAMFVATKMAAIATIIALAALDDSLINNANNDDNDPNLLNLFVGFYMLVLGTVSLGLCDVFCVITLVFSGKIPLTEDGGVADYGDRSPLQPAAYSPIIYQTSQPSPHTAQEGGLYATHGEYV